MLLSPGAKDNVAIKHALDVQMSPLSKDQMSMVTAPRSDDVTSVTPTAVVLDAADDVDTELIQRDAMSIVSHGTGISAGGVTEAIAKQYNSLRQKLLHER